METGKKKKFFLKRFFGWLFQDSKREMEQVAKDPMNRLEIDTDIANIKQKTIYRGF